MLAKYGPELAFDHHTREAHPVMATTGAKDIRELVAELDLEPSEDDFRHSRERRKAALAKSST